MAAQPLIVIVGETASGKSALALKIAKKHSGELICADSWTVYRGFNIGTAKPTAGEQREIPHYLLDIADPEEGFSAAVFKDLANNAISDIQSRGSLPILVGGTGLYIDAVIFDYGFLPKGDFNEREKLNGYPIQQLLEEAHSRNVDLEGIDIRNKRRVIRAIETNGQKPTKREIRQNTLLLGMKPSAEHLLDRITNRVDDMLANGLEQEVARLAEQYGWEVEPMKGIGYREWQDYFSGIQSKEITRERIIQASLGLAKRQRTWFKRNPQIQWCATTEQAEKLVHDFLNTILLQ